jgi:redox-sensitive bicupin YhaK (pirin superfamily)
MGFGTHPHDNMEIITIPLEGSLEHKDSMGNGSVIRAGEIQYMRAGSGVKHSEFNPSQNEPAKLLQIWIFPEQRNVAPSYAQLSFTDEELANKVHTILAPDAEPGKILINQKAWVSLAKPEKGVNLECPVQRGGNGLYVFVIEGKVSIEGNDLHRRDAAAITDAKSLNIHPEEDAFLLLLDVPLAY